MPPRTTRASHAASEDGSADPAAPINLYARASNLPSSGRYATRSSTAGGSGPAVTAAELYSSPQQRTSTSHLPASPDTHAQRRQHVANLTAAAAAAVAAGAGAGSSHNRRPSGGHLPPVQDITPPPLLRVSAGPQEQPTSSNAARNRLAARDAAAANAAGAHRPAASAPPDGDRSHKEQEGEVLSYLRRGGMGGADREHGPARTGGASGSGGLRSSSTLAAAIDSLGHRLSFQWPKTPRSGAQVVQQLEALLLWRDAWSSAKVMLGGIYACMCLRQLFHGRSIQLHPWTLACGCCLLLLLCNGLRNLWAQLRRNWHWVRHHSEPPGPTPASRFTPEAELRLQQDIATQMVQAAQCLAPYVGSVAVLTRRALAGESAGATAWTGLSLWLLMLVSELQLLSVASTALMLWVMLFTLPPLYTQSRLVMDSLVSELWDFLLWGFTDSSQRLTLLLAAAAAYTVFATLPGGLVLRLTLGLAAFTAVLAWRARALAAAAAAAASGSGTAAAGPPSSPAAARSPSGVQPHSLATPGSPTRSPSGVRAHAIRTP